MLKKTVESFLLVGAMLAATASPVLPAPKKIIYVTYRVVFSGKEVGREHFREIVTDSNIVRFEGRSEISFNGIDTTRVRTALVLEEDSYFPLSYYYYSDPPQGGLEVRADMFANVVLIQSTLAGRTKRMPQVVPTGAMMVSPSMAHHWALLVRRYRPGRGTKQRVLTFDPMVRREGSALVEYLGPDTLAGGGEHRIVSSYRVSGLSSAETDLYLDSEGIAVKVEMRGLRTDYLLMEAREETGE